MSIVEKIFKQGLLSLLFLMAAMVSAVEKTSYISGIAEGFPPYQYKNAQGKPLGFDADVLRLVIKKIGKPLSFKQMAWDDVVGTLIFTEKIDCVTGMEITAQRAKYFDFTSPYYHRTTALFALHDNLQINQLSDLPGKVIAGDRGSYLETQLQQLGIKQNIHIVQTKSKQESMQQLKSGALSAMMAPTDVGLYLANKLNIKVKIVAIAEQGAPVAIAVKKGNTQLQMILENSLQQLIDDGEIAKLQHHWLDQLSSSYASSN